MSWAQPDTIVFNYSQTDNSYILWKPSRKAPTGHGSGNIFAFENDTILWKKDSSLFNGYLKTLSSEIGTFDTLISHTNIYKISNGIPAISSSFMHYHNDLKGNYTTPWLRFEGLFVTDSIYISQTYYYSGQLLTKYENYFYQKIKINHSYDTAGNLMLIERTKNWKYDGENYIKLSNCCDLKISYKDGKVQGFESPSLLFFDKQNKNITHEQFVILLNRPSYSWGHLVIPADSLQEKQLLLYLIKDSKSWDYASAGRELKPRRTKQLLSNAMKLK